MEPRQRRPNEVPRNRATRFARSSAACESPRVSRSASVPFLLPTILLVLGLGLVSTACEDRTRNEAMLFLTRYDALDLDAPLEERRTAVASLRGLVLSSDDVRAARDACAEAYEAEIRAEDQHAEATAQLLGASAGGAETVSTEAAARIEAAIQESQEAIEQTRELFPRCERQARSLRVRFAAPRPSQR